LKVLAVKKCTNCGELKSLTQFGKKTRAPDGLHWECKTCRATESAAYRAKMQNVINEKQAKKRAENHELVIARRRQYTAKNRERLTEQNRKYYENNKGSENAKGARYRAKILQATPLWADHSKILEYYENAQELSVLIGEPCHVDHIVPLQSKIVCGLHVEHNLQVLPGLENRSKGNRHWPDMP